MQKHAQKRELLGGVEAVVATPGRLIDLVECGACKLQRVTLFVVDEVDRCFDLGFEAQACTAAYSTTFLDYSDVSKARSKIERVALASHSQSIHIRCVCFASE
jgi:hypothetical protein